MKKNILVFGLVTGVILTAYIFAFNFISEHLHGETDKAVAGYTAMVIAFSFIFVAIRNFRDKYNAGVVSFGQACWIGLAISLIGSTCYVASWLVEYYCFMPDFMDKYAAAMLAEAQHSGLSPAGLEKKVAQINNMKEMYKSPVVVVLFSYLEVLPVGIVISLITALILRRRNPRQLATA